MRMQFHFAEGGFGKYFLIGNHTFRARSRQWLRPLDLSDSSRANRFVHELHVSESWWAHLLNSIDFSYRASFYSSVKAAGVAAFKQARLRAWEVKGKPFFSSLPSSCKVMAGNINYALVPSELSSRGYGVQVDVHSDPDLPRRILQRNLSDVQLRQFYRDLGASDGDTTSSIGLFDELVRSLMTEELLLFRLSANKGASSASSSDRCFEPLPRAVPLAPPTMGSKKPSAPATVPQESDQPKPRDLNDPAVRQALFAQYGFVVGPYKDLQKIEKEGYQREHFVPHSNFMTRSTLPGEARAKVPIGSEFGAYNEGDAITYFVYDDQTKGTEHRYLTDVEKEYAKELEAKGEFATVTEWMDRMEAETAHSLTMDKIERAPGVKEPRVPPEDAADLAKAIRIEYENQLDAAGVDKNALMSNLVGGGSVAPQKAEPDGSGEDF
jgi:hypothetical protein